MMSGLEDSPAARKNWGAVRKKTEKDMYIHIFITAARALCEKENGQEQIWTTTPKNWLEEIGGKWRNPTGKVKENIADLRKKCDHILELIPEESRCYYLRLKKLADSGDKEGIHDCLSLIQSKKSLKMFPSHLRSRHPVVKILAQELKEELQNCIKVLDKDLASDTNSRKRPSSFSPATHSLKKYPKTNISNSLPTILPKPPDGENQVTIADQIIPLVLVNPTQITPNSIPISHQQKSHSPAPVKLSHSQLQKHANFEIAEHTAHQETQEITRCKLTTEASSFFQLSYEKVGLYQQGQVLNTEEMYCRPQFRCQSRESVDEGLGDEITSTHGASPVESPSTFHDKQSVCSPSQQRSSSNCGSLQLSDSAIEDQSSVLQNSGDLGCELDTSTANNQSPVRQLVAEQPQYPEKSFGYCLDTASPTHIVSQTAAHSEDESCSVNQQAYVCENNVGCLNGKNFGSLQVNLQDLSCTTEQHISPEDRTSQSPCLLDTQTKEASSSEEKNFSGSHKEPQNGVDLLDGYNDFLGSLTKDLLDDLDTIIRPDFLENVDLSQLEGEEQCY